MIGIWKNERVREYIKLSSQAKVQALYFEWYEGRVFLGYNEETICRCRKNVTRWYELKEESTGFVNSKRFKIVDILDKPKRITEEDIAARTVSLIDHLT